VRTSLRFEPAREPPRQEWFVAGTEAKVVRGAGSKALARIAYPADGTVVALDPDIPPTLQRLPLRLSAPAQRGWQWQMDDCRLGAAADRKHWLPQPGRHRLALVDAGGRELDAITFEVRTLRGDPQRR
jgi:penicillin-binding protein 1C